jgi:single-stranded-DNA-specific exonuclease
VDADTERRALQSNYDPVVARVLAGRPLASAHTLSRQLAPTLEDLDDESHLADIDLAAQRLAGAILSKEVIGIATDYDMDGLGAHATFRVALVQMFGHPAQRVRSYIGHRLAEGYGLTDAMADRVLRDLPRPAVLVTADSGSTDEPRIARLQAAGVDVLVTDHHDLPTEGPPPSAYACINPKRTDCAFPDKAIAGGMVAWLLLRATKKVLIEVGHAPAREASLDQLLDFVACSTVADCVSMASSNNRAVVIAGLARMNLLHRPCWQAMAEALDAPAFRSESIAFGIAPRINARTRLADPFAALRFLLARDRSSAIASLKLLDQENEARKAIEKRMIERAIDQAARQVADGCHAITLALADGHPGVQGICSARLVEAFGRPVFLFSPHAAAPDTLTGSARTAEGIDMKQLLLRVHERAPSLIQRFGGHKAAAGAQVRREDFETFAMLFEEAAREAVLGEPLGPLRWSDGALDLRHATLDLLDALEVLEPTGKGFEPASFDGAFPVVSARPVGDGTHLRLQLTQNGVKGNAVWFRARRAASDPLPVAPGEHAHLVYALADDRFNGKRRLELRIQARVRPPAVPSSSSAATQAERSAPTRPNWNRAQRRRAGP